MKTFVSVDGHILEENSQKISVFSRGLLFGHAVFETLLAFETGFVFWKEHYSRLKKSCDFSRILCPAEKILKENCIALLKHSFDSTKVNRFSVRVLVTGGNSSQFKINRSSEKILPNSQIILYCTPVEEALNLQANGLKVYAFPDARNQKLLSVKSNNYLWNTIAHDEAQLKGFDDAVLVGENLELLELTTANFVWEDKVNHWHSTPSDGLCLPGTTLLALRGALAKLNLNYSDKILSLAALHEAQNIFAISSVRGLVPISLLNTSEFQIRDNSKYNEVNKILKEIQRKSASL